VKGGLNQKDFGTPGAAGRLSFSKPFFKINYTSNFLTAFTLCLLLHTRNAIGQVNVLGDNIKEDLKERECEGRAVFIWLMIGSSGGILLTR
jgi:hypothetical protein